MEPERLQTIWRKGVEGWINKAKRAQAHTPARPTTPTHIQRYVILLRLHGNNGCVNFTRTLPLLFILCWLPRKMSYN